MILKPKSTAGRFLKKFSWLSIIILIFAFVGYCYWSLLPVSTNKTAKTFIVKKGESVASIAKRLQSEKLIKNHYLFRGLVIIRNLTTSIQAGSFKLSPSQSPLEIVQALTKGTNDIWLTFPEGQRQEEYGQKLAAVLENFDQSEFLKLTKNLEGYLFPDTYLLPKQTIPSMIVKILTDNFQKKVGQIDRQTLILASLVEREAKHEADRVIVAGILKKRLNNHWPLQVDATLQYAVANAKCNMQNAKCDYWEPITKSDLKIKSPYNTYLYRGLPPTPICNPGLSAIQATQNPQITDYWFYLSDPSGIIHYATTAADHQQNIEKYLRVDK